MKLMKHSSNTKILLTVPDRLLAKLDRVVKQARLADPGASRSRLIRTILAEYLAGAEKKHP